MGVESVSRRNFIRWATMAASAAALAGCATEVAATEAPEKTAIPPATATLAPTETPIPHLEATVMPEAEILHGVEVFGLKEKITSKEDVVDLYRRIDRRFAEDRGIVIKEHFIERNEQRKEVLDPNERYLEVVVRQSAYDSYWERREETQVDFVEWIKMTVDAMNRVLKAGKPETEARGVLRRVIVVDDAMAAEIWDEEAFLQGEMGNFDSAWINNFFYEYPFDTDCSWAVGADYRGEMTGEFSDNGFFNFYAYSYINRGNETIFGYPPGAEVYRRTYVLPRENDALDTKDGVWLDFGLIHEWSHYLLNLPDQYVFNVNMGDETPSHFKQSMLVGAFIEPLVTAYLTMRMNQNIERKARSLRYGNWLGDHTDRPEEIVLKTSVRGGEVIRVSVHKVIPLPGYYGKKIFNRGADQAAVGNEMRMSPSLFGNEPEISPHVWLIHCETSWGAKDVYIPSAVWEMSRWSGMDQAEYEIEFSEFDDLNKTVAQAEMVDETDMQKYLETLTERGEDYYAKMKITGTNTWLIWTLVR